MSSAYYVRTYIHTNVYSATKVEWPLWRFWGHYDPLNQDWYQQHSTETSSQAWMILRAWFKTHKLFTKMLLSFYTECTNTPASAGFAPDPHRGLCHCTPTGGKAPKLPSPPITIFWIRHWAVGDEYDDDPRKTLKFEQRPSTIRQLLVITRLQYIHSLRVKYFVFSTLQGYGTLGTLHVYTTALVSNLMQGRGDGSKASTSWVSEAARVKAELDCATLRVCFAYMPKP